MAAEISAGRGSAGPESGRFNEAAANGRGNRAHRGAAGRDAAVASMRPRRMAAEIEIDVATMKRVVNGLQ